MRTIEEQMIAAIRARKDWKSGNTQVAAFPAGVVKVFLHGNHIATLRSNGVDFTLAGWNTPTTRSRLNAILQEFAPRNRVYTKKGEPRWYREYDGGSYDQIIDDSRAWIEVRS